MRINKYIALASGISRRSADRAIQEGRVAVNGRPAVLGDEVKAGDAVTLDKSAITPVVNTSTIILNKPVGYVCSRSGQGSKTIYDLLPNQYHRLKPAGRLDKDSSGLILLTDNGELANRLTHPRYQKQKIYKVKLDKKLTNADMDKLLTGVVLEDGVSKFIKVTDCSGGTYEVTLAEGRNRQISRSFNTLGYDVTSLQRTQLGDYELGALKLGEITIVQ